MSYLRLLQIESSSVHMIRLTVVPRDENGVDGVPLCHCTTVPADLDMIRLHVSMPHLCTAVA